MIRLHHCPGTRSMRSLWLLHELGVPFEVESYAFDKTLRSPGYRALHPAGRVPALEIDGDVMFETGAIAEYLCERFPEAGLGRMPGEPDRMEFLTWLHFAETLTVHVAMLTQQHVVIREDHQRSPFLMALEARRLTKALEAVEGRLSSPIENRDTLLTSGFSACDVGVGQAVWAACHFVRLDDVPQTAAWFARLCDRPAFRLSLPPEGQGIYGGRFFAAPDLERL